MREGMLERREWLDACALDAPLPRERLVGPRAGIGLGERPQPAPDAARRALLEEHFAARDHHQHRDAPARASAPRPAPRKLVHAVAEACDAVGGHRTARALRLPRHPERWADIHQSLRGGLDSAAREALFGDRPDARRNAGRRGIATDAPTAPEAAVHVALADGAAP